MMNNQKSADQSSRTVLTVCSEEIRKTRNERGDGSLQHSSRSKVFKFSPSVL